MIHRIDRVNPDVDDRVIKPNEARFAENLRFGASTEDTNLSGGTLILGNTQLDFVPPAGVNKVVGTLSDLENRVVYFAMYNDNGTEDGKQHGIYRINSGTDDSVDTIAQGNWLNFQSDDTYNVSMATIRGLLYWTDNVNEPRVINIEKGIRTQTGATEDIYPFPIEDWHYTQIKRPPGQALLVNPQLENDLPGVSLTKQNRALTQTGFQYSYYYVYDNNEESRLAPYSIDTFSNYNVTLTIPEAEFNAYASNAQIIKAFVIVIRNGNDGVWRELRYIKNDGATRTFLFRDILSTSLSLVSSDIVDARYDSVPLVSKTNEIAQNRLNHANYVVDYPRIDGIEFKASITRITSLEDENIYNDRTDRSFVPWGRYNIGVEFVDKYGRTQPVSNVSEAIAGVWLSDYTTSDGSGYGNSIPLENVNSYIGVTPTITDQKYYRRVAEYSIKGDIPDWVDRVNIVRSKAKNIIQFNQSMGRIYLWYQKNAGGDYFFTWVPYAINPYIVNQPQNKWNMNEIYDGGDTNTKYTFIGYVVEFAANEGFVASENQYIYFNTDFSAGGDPTPNNEVYATISKFKVNNIIGNRIYVKASDGVQINPNFEGYETSQEDRTITPYTLPVACFNTEITEFGQMSNINNYIPLFYNFTLTQEGNFDEQILYTTEATYTAKEYKDAIAINGEVKGYLFGDARISLSLKTTIAQSYNIKIFNPGQINGQPVIKDAVQNINAQGWYGFFISMSPIDIFNQKWNQNIGQVNTTSYLDSQNLRQDNQICFSNPTVGSTQVNGLNKFNSADFRSAPVENGPITALINTNATQREPGVLLAVGAYGVSSFYYDAVQLTNVDGTSNVTTTNSYLASQRPLLGQFGTSRPMSITKTPLSTVYWWSDVVNDLVRYSNAGLERLGLTYSFSNYLRQTYGGNALITTWYDQVTDEINLVGKGLATATFSERYKTFQGTRSYINGDISPERSIGAATKFYNFLGGEIWKTDVNNTAANDSQLFGEYKMPKVAIITNEQPAVMKTWNQIKMFGPHPTTTELVAVANSTVSSGNLLSTIDYNWWIERKNVWEAAIRRSITSQGGVLAGKIMESRILYSIFAFDPQSFDKINFIEVKSNSSIVQ